MIKAVLFDLDGTLADTARDLGAALNRLLAEEGRAPLSYELIRPVASHGARGLVQLGFGADLDADRMEALRVRFMDLYDANLAGETTLFDGVNELISELDRRGVAWGIITNKSMRFTDRLVPWLPFAIPPAVIVSGDTVGVAKPDPKPMLHATSQIGIAPEHCMYVGDAERDIQAGRNVGMKTVLVSWGYFSEQDKPEQWGADIDIDHPLQLLDHL
ncbi:HAD family hydrolase [Chromobacterium vaccinii]|uniref:phosphoglycolate phosphatase n=1 Tax=Chromobacterium vaccinii TaxID=1108595 RepID=A0A1D9LED7_9NEIS|nr:HAD-IA family hydrolase [Chromobacterium vaccinii]AOZ49631.1 phosphoglycolate phosphatase [Chromobacterium vaccinii]